MSKLNIIIILFTGRAMSSQPWRKSSKSMHCNRWKAVLVLPSLKTYDDIRVLRCFGVFWTVSDIVFKTYILPTCDFLNLSCKPDSFHIRGRADSISDTSTGSDRHCGTERGLACETKPTVCKHKQKHMQPSSNKHELMVQRC